MTDAYPKRNGKPEMRNSVVLVIDILGFARLSQDSTPDQFQKLYKAIARAQGFLKPIVSGSYELKAYSDNVAICWPIGPRSDSEFPLGVTMLQAAAFQMSLIADGYDARGGLAIGDVFADRRTIFGPALIEAHKQERITKHPRIALAPSAISHAMAHVQYYSRVAHAPQNNELLIDLKDSCVFIDYLNSWSGNYDDPEMVTSVLLPRQIKNHRAHIEAKLSANTDRKIRSKYVWLAKYHNYVTTRRIESIERIARYHEPSRFATLVELDAAQRNARRSKRGSP
jgi:hypothetical protein